MGPFQRTSNNSARVHRSLEFDAFESKLLILIALHTTIIQGAEYSRPSFLTQMKDLKKMYDTHSGTAMNEHLKTINEVFSEEYAFLIQQAAILQRKKPVINTPFVVLHPNRRKQPNPVRSPDAPLAGWSLISSNLPGQWLKVCDTQDVESYQVKRHKKAM
jgi:hypothetical protein